MSSRGPVFGLKFKSQALRTRGSGSIRTQRSWQEAELRAGHQVRRFQHKGLHAEPWDLELLGTHPLPPRTRAELNLVGTVDRIKDTEVVVVRSPGFVLQNARVQTPARHLPTV